MSHQEAYVTNKRYINEDLVWGRPKSLLIGNFPGTGPEQKANLYPDKSATYFVANICLPLGSTLIIKGTFPHSRYISFTIANQLGGGQIGNGNYIRSSEIIPDRGSLNPFVPGVGRHVPNRNFTLYLVQGRTPTVIPPNTLYTDTTLENERAHFSIRTYLPDRGYDGTGNVMLNATEYKPSQGLPDLYLSLFGGDGVDGPDLLTVLRAEKLGDPNGYVDENWVSLIANSSDPIRAPCLPVPIFQVFWNTDYSVTGEFEALEPVKRVIEHPPGYQGGFANNPDTKYQVAIVSFAYGEVVVIQGKMPTHPKTRLGGDKLPEDPQVQYFSISTSAGPGYGAGWDTVFDEQIPVDRHGYYTVVVSWPWNRPANATIENGVAWLNPGGGEGHYIGSRIWTVVVYIRFQGCSQNWTESPENIPMPTVARPMPKDAVTMGPYYPRAEYMSRQEFDEWWMVPPVA